MRVKLTPGFVARPPAPEAGRGRAIYWDAGLPSFGLQVTAGGHASYVLQYRSGSRSRRMSLKAGLGLDAARREARKLLGDVARGGDPLIARRKAAAADGNTFRAVAQDYVTREGGRLRSMGQRVAILERVVYPAIGARPIDDIKRSDVVRLLDKIEDERGAVAADYALAVVRRVMGWHASRTDEYRSPIVRGMSRTRPLERARDRVLTDDELRAVWAAAEADEGVFGPLVQFLLCTATRRCEASEMERAELHGDVWSIPAVRYKNKLAMELPLSPLAGATLARVPKIGSCRFVFSTDGSTPFSGFSKAKQRFDVAAGVTGWTLHDLRRTARSLMSRAGVSADVAERCLGHVMTGVRGTYDRHAYFEEKRAAFQALSGQIERILSPAHNVVSLAEARA